MKLHCLLVNSLVPSKRHARAKQWKRSCQALGTVVPSKGNARAKRKKRVPYLFFFQSLLISSSVFPFVSGTQRQTKMAAVTQIIP